MDPALRHVSLVLVELGRAVKARSMLRAGEPRLEETLERAHLACAAELARAGVLELVMDGRLLRLGHGGPRLTLAPAVELARVCRERGLLGVRLDKDLALGAFCALVESLADTPESRRPAGFARRRNVPTPPRELDPAEIERDLEAPVEAAIAEADPTPDDLPADDAPAASAGPLTAGRPDDLDALDQDERLDDALGEPLQEELPDALLSSLPPPEPQDEIEPDPLAAAGPGLGIEPDALALGDEVPPAGPEPIAAPEPMAEPTPVAEPMAERELAAVAAPTPALRAEPEPLAAAAAVAQPVAAPARPAALEPVIAPEPVRATEPVAKATPVAVQAPRPVLAPAASKPALDEDFDDMPVPVGVVPPGRRSERAPDELAEMLRLASDAADRRARSEEDRLEAMARLRAMASGPRLDLLLQRACSDETPASLQASQVLLALGSEFIPKLLDAIAAEKHPKRRGHLNGILIAMGEAAAPHLVRELEIADPVRARTTAWLAGEIQHPAAVPALTARLRGSDPVLRREAAKALAKISHPSAISILVQTLDGKDAELAAQAAHCLAVSGRTHGLEAVRQRLHGACERNELPLAREILLMLGRRGRPDVVPDLVAILGRKSLLRRQSLRELKIAALHALSKLPGDEARAALADVAANGDATIREAAQGALARRDRNEPSATPPPDAAS